MFSFPSESPDSSTFDWHRADSGSDPGTEPVQFRQISEFDRGTVWRPVDGSFRPRAGVHP